MITTKYLQMLVNKNVELVCFAQFSVNIHFEDKTLLTIEATFEHSNKQQGFTQLCSFPMRESSLMRIVEHSVTRVALDIDSNLQVSFSDGSQLHVQRQVEFESYRLRIGREEHVG